MAAVRNHCLECVGYDASEVERCSAPACWLYPWRFGMHPDRAAQQGKAVESSADSAHAGYVSQNEREPQEAIEVADDEIDGSGGPETAHTRAGG